MTNYRIAPSEDHELDSLSSSSCKLSAAAVPRISLHNYKADLIKPSSSHHDGIRNVDLNSSTLSPFNWYASKLDDDRRSLASPAPFSDLLDEQDDDSSEEPSSLPHPSRPQNGCSLPRRFSLDRKQQCQIALQQQTTSEICLPLPARLPRAQFCQKFSLSEEFVRPEKLDGTPNLPRPWRRSSARIQRLSISRPLPDSFVHFRAHSSKCVPNHQNSSLSRGTPWHSFDGAPRYLPHDVLLNTKKSVSETARPVMSETRESLDLNSKVGYLISRIWNRLKKEISKPSRPQSKKTAQSLK